jgi:hypothetical protein
MDEELKQYLDGMEDRIVERTTDRIMERVDGRVDAVEERMRDFARQTSHDLETKFRERRG